MALGIENLMAGVGKALQMWLFLIIMCEPYWT